MNETKRKFIQGYIDKLAVEIKELHECDPKCFEQAEDSLFDLILEIRNVFKKELPEIKDAILIINGSGFRDAKSVIGLLELYLINEGVVPVSQQNQKKLDDTFLVYASKILGATDGGLTGADIVKYCNSYAMDFSVQIPHGRYPFSDSIPNKRTALEENLRAFNAEQQFKIIHDLTGLLQFQNNEKIKELKIKLYTRYGNLASEKIAKTELITKTRHWLIKHPASLEQYDNALAKYEGGIFERNTLDDMRLAFELLVKSLLDNEKSLENNIADLGVKLKNANASVELRNMCTQIIRYYTDFQNNHVKHNDKINENEIEYVIELTSVVMKFLIKIMSED